jgi:hypothetical protein
MLKHLKLLNIKENKTMRKVFTILAAVLLTAAVWAQSPKQMSYQAVVRNASDALVKNSEVGMRISILQGSVSGTSVYVETHKPTTNDNGLVSVSIGGGTVVSGAFESIDWTNGPYFIKTETDPDGGTSYSIMGSSQLLSVPYALHAKTAGSVELTSEQIAILKGAKGDQGVQGIPGANGQDGVDGAPGVAGQDGADGLSAYEVAVAAGFVGTESEWLSSLQGVQGEQGAQGESGDQGIPGANGQDGVAGAPGVAGQDGADGLSAYEVAVAAGFVGTESEWLSSLQGIQGERGAQGEQGDPGVAFDDTQALTTKTWTSEKIHTELALKVSQEAGKGLSTDDYSTAEKEKLAVITGTNTGDQDLSRLAPKITVDALENKLRVVEIKIAILNGSSIAEVLGNYYSVSELLAAGVSVLGLIDAGVPVSDLIDAGAPVADLLAASVSVSDLLIAGAPVSDLLAASVSVSDLLVAGVSVSDLIAAGATDPVLIGKEYQGGKIAYILQSGDPGYDANVVHGLIAATEDQSTGIQWYNDEFIITGTTGTALGSGLANTDAIITSQGSTAINYAAGLARACDEGGYSDWYLPSKDELNKLFINQTAIGGFASNMYWSSSQIDVHTAWIQNFDIYMAYQSPYGKSVEGRVRAVRSF